MLYKFCNNYNNNTAEKFTYLARLKENSNFLSGPFGDELLDFDGASFGGASLGDSLGCALDEPVTQIHKKTNAIIQITYSLQLHTTLMLYRYHITK